MHTAIISRGSLLWFLRIFLHLIWKLHNYNMTYTSIYHVSYIEWLLVCKTSKTDYKNLTGQKCCCLWGQTVLLKVFKNNRNIDTEILSSVILSHNVKICNIRVINFFVFCSQSCYGIVEPTFVHCVCLNESQT